MAETFGSAFLKAAAPFKPFAAAVAAVARDMFAHDATHVMIEFGTDADRRPYVDIRSDRAPLEKAELSALFPVRFVNVEDAPAWVLAFTYHSELLSVELQNRGFIHDMDDFITQAANDLPPQWRLRTARNTVTVRFWGLGQGPRCVNRLTHRTPEALVKGLVRYLSARELRHVEIRDENGGVHLAAGKGASSTTQNGYDIYWPARMVDVGTISDPSPLILQCGGVRIPMATFLGRVVLDEVEQRWARPLLSPWASGVLEVQPRRSDSVPILPGPLTDFPDDFYRPGGVDVKTLARAIIESSVPEKVIIDMIGVVGLAMRPYVGEDNALFLHERRYTIQCATPHEVLTGAGDHRAMWLDRKVGPVGERVMMVDPTHRIFGLERTLDGIMQIIWWQLAVWIQVREHDVFPELLRGDSFARKDAIYLALRDQNPRRS